MAETVEAVYEKGVFKPLQDAALSEGEKVTLLISPASHRRTPAEILKLAHSVYQGLSEAEIAEVEAIAFDRSRFFTERS
jgi:predicted DNA-binding antitoxin AbrB/MazE fold protein